MIDVRDRRSRGLLPVPRWLGLLLALTAGAAVAAGGPRAHTAALGAGVVLLSLLGVRWTARRDGSAVLARRGAAPEGARDPTMPGLWRAGMLLLGAFLLLILAIRLPGVQALDASLLYRFNRCGSPAVSVALRRFSNFGGGDLTRYGIPLALLAHWATGRARSIRFFLFGMLGTVGLETFFKTIAHRMRPDVVSDRAYNSFPSGHVLAATVFAGLLLVLWLPACRRPRQRIILGAAALAWPVLMSIARVYLGSHYPTDVLGGLLLGSAWLCLCLALIRVPAAQPKPRAGTTTPATTGLPSASVVAAPADGLTEAASEPAPEPVLLR